MKYRLLQGMKNHGEEKVQVGEIGETGEGLEFTQKEKVWREEVGDEREEDWEREGGRWRRGRQIERKGDRWGEKETDGGRRRQMGGRYAKERRESRWEGERQMVRELGR